MNEQIWPFTNLKSLFQFIVFRVKLFDKMKQVLHTYITYSILKQFSTDHIIHNEESFD